MLNKESQAQAQALTQISRRARLHGLTNKTVQAQNFLKFTVVLEQSREQLRKDKERRLYATAALHEVLERSQSRQRIMTFLLCRHALAWNDSCPAEPHRNTWLSIHSIWTSDPRAQGSLLDRYHICRRVGGIVSIIKYLSFTQSDQATRCLER